MIYLVSILVIIGVLIFYRVSTPFISRNKRILLGVLRSSYIIILCIFLFNPVLFFLKKQVIQDKVIILNDDSESMEIKFNNQEKTKYYNEIKDNLINMLDAKGINYDIHNLSEYNELKKKSSYILPFFEFIKKKNNFHNIKGIFFLSDGWIHDENLQALSSSEIPVYTFNTGLSEEIHDIKIEDIQYNKTAYRSETALIKAKVNAGDSESVIKVQFLTDKKVIQEKSVKLIKNQVSDIDFEIQFNQTGLIPFSVQLSNVKDDYIHNNYMAGAIQVVESKQRIALISDVLNFDVLYLSQLLQANKRYNTDIIIQKNKRFYKNGISHHLNLKDYASVIMVNNGSLSMNNEFKNNLLTLMDQSFGVLSIGYPINGIEEISPVTKSNISNLFRGNFKVSPSANQYQIFENLSSETQNIPIVSYLYLTVKNQGLVLSFIENESKSPWIVYRSYLNSHIFHICGFDIWKWKSLSGTDSYDNFFNGLIDWISRKNNERFYAYTDKNTYLYGECVSIMLNAYDESFNTLNNISPAISLKKEGKSVTEDFLVFNNSQYHIKIENLKPGKYDYQVIEKAKNLSTNGVFMIHSKNKELYETGFNNSMLAMLSHMSKGRFVTSKELDQFILKPSNHTVVQQKIELQLYKKWQVILLFITLICMEYFLRKRWGLL